MSRSGLLIAGVTFLISQSAMGQDANAQTALADVWHPWGVPHSQSAVAPSKSPVSTGLATSAPGDGVLGQGDPSDAKDPAALTGVWRGYSAVDPSIYPNNLIISTDIAYSSDKGKTFSTLLALNPGSDLSTSGWTWVNEVSSLVYDPADPSINSVWKIIWDHHININGTVDGNIAWLGFRTADVPNGTWSSETKLIAGNAYDPNNSLSPGPTVYPLPSALSDCTFLSEPGTLTASDGFYMSLSCFPSSGPPRTPLVKFTHSGTGNPVLQVLGTLLNNSTDAAKFANRYGNQFPELRTTIAFTQSDIETVSGNSYLIVSPVGQNPSLGLYNMGCAVFRITNLATASIQRTSNGTPSLVKYVQGPVNTPRGACAYSPQDTASGINLSEFVSTNPVPFQIVETLVQLP